MPDPIGSCRPSSSTDEILHRVVSARPEASALPTPDAAPDSAREATPARPQHDDATEMLHHGAVALESTATTLDVAEPALEHAGVMVAGLDLVGGATSIASQVLAVWGQLREGERRGIEVDSAQMQGALAALEGRTDGDDVVARAQRDPAFASGLHQMERLFYSDHDAFVCASEQVRAIGLEGERAVLSGSDRGPQFERRYEHDLAFRHGVERARERRERSPAQYEAEQRQIRELQRRMEDARGTSAIRG